MEITLTNIVALLTSLVIGGGVGTLLISPDDNKIKKMQEKSGGLIACAKKEEANIFEDTKKQCQQSKEALEIYMRHRKEKLEKLQEFLNHKIEMLKKREEKTDSIKMLLQEEATAIRKFKDTIRSTEEEITNQLIQKTHLSKEEAKTVLLEKVRNDIKSQKEYHVQKIEQNTQQEATKISTNLLAEVMQRYSAESSVEKRGGNVYVPKDSIKGLIIGKNGVNIAYFEHLLDVDVIFNHDDPQEITISVFDLVKRHIAKLAINALIKEKKAITPETIRKHVEAALRKTDDTIFNYGNQAMKNYGIAKIMKKIGMEKIDTELIKIVGRLQFRTSFGQNIMMHSLEVGAFSALLAGEIGADVDRAYLAGFFHDIGKAIDQNIEESHDVLTKQILEKFHFPEDIVHAAWAHHEGEPVRTPEAQVVKAADAISAGRPGARQDSLTKHIERIQGLEEIGYSFAGIKKAYAISGGRELRMIVDEYAVMDNDMQAIVKEAVSKIKEKLTYPGKIKVNVIRRMKSVAYANKEQVLSS